MGRYPRGSLLVLVALLLTSACTKIPTPSLPGQAGVMVRERLPDSTSVPSAWGSLVAVSTTPQWGNVFELWFQDAGGNIRLAILDVTAGRMGPTATLITRK